MKYRNGHAHNWLLAPPDGASLVGSYVCSVCGAQRSITAFHIPQVVNNFATQEIALWMEYLVATIARQEKAIRKIREQVPTAKSPCVRQTLTHLERSLAVHKRTLQQFEVGSRMILGQPSTSSSIKLPIHQKSSVMSC